VFNDKKNHPVYNGKHDITFGYHGFILYFYNITCLNFEYFKVDLEF